ncbi:MAG: heparin lyase I family protein [Bacteroidota bacterium]
MIIGKYGIWISVVFLLLNCDKERFFEGPDQYIDDFESYELVDELFFGDNEKWSFTQQTFEGNSLSVSREKFHSGTQSIKFSALNPSDSDSASKASIVKQKMAFWEGETVSADFWIYLEGNEESNWLFLFDLEEQATIGAGPGIRLALVENALLIEHKYPNPNIEQKGEKLRFPRDEWVNIQLEIKLSRKKEGYIKVWQNENLIIDQSKWKTLPKDILYFQQGTKGMYSSVEFGITANTLDNPTVLYVDDVEVKVLE